MTELQNTSDSSSYNNWLDRPNTVNTTQLPPINFKNNNNNITTMNPGTSYPTDIKEENADTNDDDNKSIYPYMATPNASSSWLNNNNTSPKESCEMSYDSEEYHQHGQPTPSPTASTERSRSKKHRTPSTRDIHVERNTEGKPPYSYATLIKYAIENSQRKKLTLSEIYQWVIDHYPYYATAGSGWKVQ